MAWVTKHILQKPYLAMHLTPPQSTEYENIVMNTPNRTCSDSNMCTALNCPFKEYDEDLYIDCIPLTNMSLLFPTPDDELPPDPTEELFFNFGVHGESGSESVNGRNIILPMAHYKPSEDMKRRRKCVCLETLLAQSHKNASALKYIT